METDIEIVLIASERDTDYMTGLQSSLKPAILKILKTSSIEGTTIVYTTFQTQADEIAGYLSVNGVSAASYHAGKSHQVLP